MDKKKLIDQLKDSISVLETSIAVMRRENQTLLCQAALDELRELVLFMEKNLTENRFKK